MSLNGKPFVLTRTGHMGLRTKSSLPAPCVSRPQAEFFATVQRDSAEVAAEEASCASVQLADLSDIAAVRLAAAAAAAGAGGRTAAAGGGGRHHGHGHTASSLSREAAGERRTHLGAGGVEAEVQLAAGVSFRCMCGVADRSAGAQAWGSGGLPPCVPWRRGTG